jgi:hypothetical protein
MPKISSPPPPGPRSAPTPDPGLSPTPPAGDPLSAAAGDTGGAVATTGVGSGSGAMVSGSMTIGADGGELTAGSGAGSGGFFAGVPPPPRAAGRGSGIQTRWSGSTRVTVAGGLCSRRCDTTSRIVTITNVCTATDTTTAGVRWRGWLSTHSFDARSRPSVGDLNELLQGALGTCPAFARLPAVERGPGAVAVERDDVASECDRCACELAV